MADAHRLDCESAEADCRFIVQSEAENEAIELARNHMEAIHGKEFSDGGLCEQYLQQV